MTLSAQGTLSQARRGTGMAVFPHLSQRLLELLDVSEAGAEMPGRNAAALGLAVQGMHCSVLEGWAHKGCSWSSASVQP